ncbi:MAG TPA: polyphosphate kinase, partial [Pyrinomonadaceae bacterium]|nr:polyphosphate kinase [Pyrinomonadaceae bacterium]
MSAEARTLSTEEGSGETRLVALPSSLVHQKHLLFNRELSWLEFNRRVLEEAQDATQPLLERLKFLAIFSTNLDEFFMVRVSGLMEELEEEVTQESPDGMTPAEQLKAISERLRPLVGEQTRCLTEDVLPQLAARGVVVKSYRELSREEKEAADTYFEERIFPVLTPQAVDPAHPFPYISNLSLNIGIMVEPRGGGDDDGDVAATVKSGRRFARVKIPPVVPHLVPVDGSGRKFVFVGSLIAANVASLFPEMRTGKCHLFRVTRDADFEIREDEAGDLLRTMQQHLRRRRFGATVRLEVNETMPAEMVEYLTTSLDLAPQDVYTIAGPLNIPDLMQLYSLELPELKDRPLKPSVPPQLSKPATVFDAVRRQDVLLHHPFNSYNTVVDFIGLAAADPEVLAIKICLYRTGRHSPVVQALIDATERGKQVAALV